MTTNTDTPTTPPTDSPLIEFAKREFRYAGWTPMEEAEDGPDKWAQENILELLEVLKRQGHSPMSAPFIIHAFTQLAQWKPLTPLTGDADEWHAAQEETEMEQNKRCPEVFRRFGVAYRTGHYVFAHPQTRPLEPGEEGYPGTREFTSHFTSKYSSKVVEFPYQPGEPEIVPVEMVEVDEEGNPCPGSGNWDTLYPEFIHENARTFTIRVAAPTPSDETPATTTTPIEDEGEPLAP